MRFFQLTPDILFSLESAISSKSCKRFRSCPASAESTEPSAAPDADADADAATGEESDASAIVASSLANSWNSAEPSSISTAYSVDKDE